MDSEGDRLSGLQDDLILQILSFVGLKDAIGTSVLSPRWRYIWTSTPHLSFSSEDFPTTDKFSNFVNHVLSRRNNQAQVSSVNLYLRLKDGQDVAHRIMNYAFSHNVQRVNLTCWFGNITCFPDDDIGFSLSLSNSQTIKHLTFSRCCYYDHIALTSTSKLSSLTTLHLDHITLYDGFFSNCANLENLTLNCCRMMGSNAFKISHPRLCNLTVNQGQGHLVSNTLDVAAPQLKNLTITEFGGSYRISAPELASLLFRGFAPFMFSTDALNLLEKAQLSLYSLNGLDSPDAPSIISLLQKLHNVEDFSLSVEIIELLNSAVELISHQAPPFANLKSLKILPRINCGWKHQHVQVIMSTEVKSYLLDSSLEATLIEVPSEHCCDLIAARALIFKKAENNHA
ncbi:putative F-box domain, leucine-rich repeat domain superfamily, F-box-like domain superfamily [Helianthus annuus]|nr:putative F-box domain, leucine-rich repeat domain superfamily, F-box-like domain superfamily [Helianthus annuus]